MIFIKRAYDPPGEDDGQRILVDRLWPRGVKKESLKMDSWNKEVAPSDALRTWFGHDVDRWCEFNERYFAELDDMPAAWNPLLDAACRGNLTLLFAAKDTQHNNAVTLRAYLEKHLKMGA